MSQNRKLLSPDEQAKAISIMMRFKDIHEGIAKLERQMDEIKQQKELMLTDLDLARADDEFFQSQLEAAYGPGKLDAPKLEWVTKTEQDEDTDDDTRLSEDA